MMRIWMMAMSLKIDLKRKQSSVLKEHISPSVHSSQSTDLIQLLLPVFICYFIYLFILQYFVHTASLCIEGLLKSKVKSKVVKIL